MRSHMLWSNCRVPQLLNLCSRAQEPQLLNPKHPRARAPQQEMLPQREACALQLETSPCSLHLEKSWHSNKDTVQTK